MSLLMFISGSFLQIGTMGGVLLKKRVYKDQMETMIAQYVFPEFQSPFGFMRARVSAGPLVIFVLFHFVFCFLILLPKFISFPGRLNSSEKTSCILKL